MAAVPVRGWLARHHMTTLYIDSGCPWQNRHGERFNGTMRDECLHMPVFHSVAEARAIVAPYRRHYHEERPHSSLGYRPPMEFTQDWLTYPSQSTGLYWAPTFPLAQIIAGISMTQVFSPLCRLALERGAGIVVVLLLLLGTAIIVWRYTMETQRLRTTAERQSQLLVKSASKGWLTALATSRDCLVGEVGARRYRYT